MTRAENPQAYGTAREQTPALVGTGSLEITDNERLEKLKEKKEPSLGELNPLLFPPKLDNPEAVEALKLAISRKIGKYNGVPPSFADATYIYNYNTLKQEMRFIIRFETTNFTGEQLTLVEQTIKAIYGLTVKTRTDTKGASIPPISYPELGKPAPKKQEGKQVINGKFLGWYMGPEFSDVENTHMGVLVFRDLGEEGMAKYLSGHAPKEWFFKDDLVTPMNKPIPPKYSIEIREAGLYQTDLVELATQLSSILANGKPIEDRLFKYEVYNDLNRMGLKKTGRGQVYGIDQEIERMERVLLLPLANLGASLGIELNPSSILLVGVPGTGKTLVAEYLLQQDYGVFIVPIDPLNLARELSEPPEKKWILPRISQVFHQTRIPVILHIDDVENIAKEDQAINSALLNLMAGVRERGFYVIASTNHPEKIHQSLLQPQRFEHLVYLGLPNEEARRGILEIHATRVSKELRRPLFTSEDERAVILQAIAKNTDGFTARFLAAICIEAKSFYLARVAEHQKKKAGMEEDDLEGTFCIQDWENGFAEVVKRFPKEQTDKRNREIGEFAKRFYRPAGFARDREDGRSAISLRRTIEDLFAARKDPSLEDSEQQHSEQQGL